MNILRAIKAIPRRLRQIMGLEARPEVIDHLIPERVIHLDKRSIKRKIPRSWFTKTGPGVRDAGRRAFLELTLPERGCAVAWGWFPRSWL